LLQLDEDFLTFEVRSETKRIPRELVSHIIWVNADEVESAASGANDTGTSASGNASASASGSGSGNVNGNGNPGENVGSGVGKSASPAATVTAAEKTAAEKAAVGKTAAEKTVVGNANTNLTMLALRKDGVRIGLEPTRCENSVFTGTNRILGEVRVDMRDVDQFLIGGAIGEAGAQLPYAQWRWKPAALPKVATVQSDAPGGSRRPGTDSPLVGKPAPEFKLPMLAGKDDFELGKQRGRIVVLDFWATWCGPCLKTIPVLERVVREQPAEAKVDLIAVNLEEAPRQITAMLERHGWKLAVALDQDGAVASKYAANAIPQTVIVDREGKVARLFVGGGPQFEAELRAALTEILTPAMP
jgi:thiol-disulfide isomerase/thioredoxin